MEYFVLYQEMKLKRPFVIDMVKNDLSMDDAFVLFGEIKDNTSLPEFLNVKQLCRTYYFASDRLKRLLDCYSDDIWAVPVFFTDVERSRQECYWKLYLPEIECLSENTAERYDNLHVRADKIEGEYIFRAVSGMQEYIVVSLHIAEHILRSSIYGIKLYPVTRIP